MGVEGALCHRRDCAGEIAMTDTPQNNSDESQAKPTEADRIAKVMARAGVASRREAERMIVEGRVTVNGKKIDSPALDVLPTDRITVDGKKLEEPQETRVWLYYKPLGLVTTESDEKGRQTIFDAMPRELPRVMTVGRLDLNSEGLLLLTNDGELKRRLELPATGWLRRYRVRVNGTPSDLTFAPLRRGVTIDGEEFAPMEIKLDSQQGANAWLTVGIREGKNREIRRAMSHVGLQVNRLIRIGYGPFKLSGMEKNQVVEVKRKVLRDQLGGLLTGEATEKEREMRPRGAERRSDDRPFREGGPRRFGGKPGEGEPRRFGAKPFDGERRFGGKPADGERRFGGKPADGERRFGGKPADGERRFGGKPAEGERRFGGKPADGERRFGGKPADGERRFGGKPADGERRFGGKPAGEGRGGFAAKGDRPARPAWGEGKPARKWEDRKPEGREDSGDRPRFAKGGAAEGGERGGYRGDKPREGGFGSKPRSFGGKPRQDDADGKPRSFGKPRQGEGDNKPRSFGGKPKTFGKPGERGPDGGKSFKGPRSGGGFKGKPSGKPGGFSGRKPGGRPGGSGPRG
jgi:23S rRNA pseudouridine2605 synthase